MSSDYTSSNRHWWFEILRDEKRWLSRLVREGEIGSQDEFFIRQQSGLCFVVSTLMVLLVRRPVWRFAERCFFVSFGTDELCQSARLANPQQFESLNFGWRAIFKGSRLGFVLNTVYMLIHRPGGLPRWVRKMLLVWHFRFLENLLPQLSRTIFLVKQDYFGPSSLLVTLSWHLPLPVAGVQHGLMDTNYILQQRLYPGIRTRIEYAYDFSYRKIFSQVKPSFTVTEVLGPPYDCTDTGGLGLVTPQLVFISSGQMRSKEGRAIVDRVRVLAEGDGFIFLLRPHPSEKDIEQLKSYRLERSSMSAIFNMNPEGTIFIGIFSSLLYQAAFKGFRTLWLLNGTGEGVSHPAFLAYLPNAVPVSWGEIATGALMSYLNKHRQPICSDSSSDRLTALLQVSFPDILERVVQSNDVVDIHRI